MKSGTLGTKFWAAVYVKIDSPVKDEDGEVILKPNPPKRGRHEAARFEKIPRRTEVAYWSDTSEAHARSQLTAHLASKGYEADTARTAAPGEMGLEKSVNKFKRKRDLAAKAKLVANAEAAKANGKSIVTKVKDPK